MVKTRTRNALHSGIGDQDDLFVKQPKTEDAEETFQYAARLHGKRQHAKEVYPELNFQYGISYKGNTLETYNEKKFEYNVNAHPERKIEYCIEEKKELPVKKLWEAEACFEAEVRKLDLEYAMVYKGHTGKIDKRTAEYAVKWQAEATIQDHGDIKELFTDKNGHFIGYADGSTGWKKVGDHVQDARNRSFFSGVIAKSMYDWNSYEASFKFKPIINNKEGNFGKTKRYNSNNNTFYDAPGWDDDIVGLIFQAQDRKNFYMMMWEADERVWLSGRTGNNLNGINITKKNPGFVDRQDVSEVTGEWPNYRPSKSQWRDYQNNKGWGNHHYRIYKVTNGKMKRVNVKAHGSGLGWIMNNMHRVRIVTSGKNVKIYARRAPGYTEFKMFDFNTSWSKGSFGMFNVSQSVEFHSIDVVEKRLFSGRIPEKGWDSSKANTKTISKNATSYVKNSTSFKNKLPTGVSSSQAVMKSITGIIRNSKNGSITINNRSGPIIVKAKDYSTYKEFGGRLPASGWYIYEGPGTKELASNAQSFVREKIGKDKLILDKLISMVNDEEAGSVDIYSMTGPIKLHSTNAPDAGEIYNECYYECDVVEITPDNYDFESGRVIFHDIKDVFREHHATFFNRDDFINKKEKYELLTPEYKEPPKPPILEDAKTGCVIEKAIEEVEFVVDPCLNEFDFNGKKLVMWSCEFPIELDKKCYTTSLFAYEGWIVKDHLKDFQLPNPWTSYKLHPNEATIYKEFDEIMWDGYELHDMVPPKTKIKLRTTEWYRAIFPADIENEGIATSEENLSFPLPPSPEHYWHPRYLDSDDIKYRMPDRFDEVHYLLDAWENHRDIVIWYESDPSQTTENIDKKITASAGRVGMPILKTNKHNDNIIVHCKEDPRKIPWTSGKYIGSGSLNGKRPFVGEEPGRADMVNVPTRVVYFPENLIMEDLEGPFIDVFKDNLPNGAHITHKVHSEGTLVDFTSEYKENHRWYTDWVSNWVKDEEYYVATMHDISSIGEVIELNPTDDVITTDITGVTVEGTEVISDNPFVDLWLEDKMLYAQVKPVTPLPWHPMIHNGYYYHKDEEHYLYADKIKHVTTPNDSHEVYVTPRPQQGSPMIVKDNEGNILRKVTFYDEHWNLTLENTEVFHGNGYAVYYLSYPGIDVATLSVKVNGQTLTPIDYFFNEDASSIQFMEELSWNDEIEVRYKLLYSYYVDMNPHSNHALVQKDEAKIVLHANYDKKKMKDMEIIYEGAEHTPFYRGTETVMNPLLSGNHAGFLYLTNQTEQQIRDITLHISARTISDKGYEKITATARVLDEYGNPCPNQEVVLFRDRTEIARSMTNTAGEVYFYDQPKPTKEKISIYRVECQQHSKEAMLNYYTEEVKERYFITIEAEKRTVLAGTNDSATIHAVLRNEQWIPQSGKEIRIAYQSTKGQQVVKNVVTDKEGRVTFQLYGANEVHGNIMVKMSYMMEDAEREPLEEAANYVHIKMIG